ncbi:MAG: DUF6531 domain-containing protein, partial [Tepidisphaeraceae bacterium]
MAGSNNPADRKQADKSGGRSKRSTSRQTISPLFALESFEQRLFFSVDPTTRKFLDVFESVYNTIEYEPYAGVMKGPVATEQTKAGNAWDQATLLVDRLRNGGFTSKYVWGRVTLPKDDVKQWLGIVNGDGSTDAEAAWDVLDLARLNAVDAGSSFTFDHTWVRSLVNGDWVNLDPSFKFKDRSEAGLNVGVEFDASDFLSQVRRETPYEYYEKQIIDKLRDDGLDGVGLSDVPYDGPIIAKRLNALPDLPATTYVVHDDPNTTGLDGIADHVPDDKLHRVRVSLIEDKPAGEGKVFDEQVNRTGQYVRIQLAGTEHLSLAEVKVFSDGANVAVGMEAGQSNTAFGGVAGRAVDGNTSGIYADNSVTHTGSLRNPYWWVNLGEIKQIDRIEVWNRGDGAASRLNNFHVFVSDTPFASADLQTTLDEPGVLKLRKGGVLFHRTLTTAGDGLKTITISDSDTSGTNVTPELRIGGVPEVTGASISQSDGKVILQIDHYDAGETTTTSSADIKRFEYKRNAAQPLAVGLGARQWTEQTLMGLQAELNDIASSDTPIVRDYQDKLLGMAGMKYFYDIDKEMSGIAGLTRTIAVRAAVHSGIMTGDASLSVPATSNDPRWTLHNPIVSENISTDNPNASVGLVAVTAAASASTDDVFDLMGWNNSALEHTLLEGLLNVESVSTVKGMQLSTSPLQSITLANLDQQFTTDPENWASDARTAIEGALNQGFTVKGPSKLVTVGGWTGAVWFQEKSGEPNGYIIKRLNEPPISGGYGGNPPVIARPINSVASNLGERGADPVNFLTGGMYHDEQDISIPNVGIPLVFARHYESRLDDGTATVAHENGDNSPFKGALKDVGLGVGWTHTYSDYLTFEAVEYPFDPDTEKATWHTADGMHHEFTQEEYTDQYYTQPGGVYGSFKREGNYYTYTEKDGLQRIFHKVGDIGRLEQIRDRNGNFLNVTYDANGLLHRVEDGNLPSRALTFAASASHPGHIESVSDFTGRTWGFGYGDHAVAGKVLVEVDGPADEDQYQRTYGYYPTGRLKGLLETITNGETDALHRFYYYPNRRAFSNAAFSAPDPANNDERKLLQQEYFSYDVLTNTTTGYDNLATRYVDPSGGVTTYVFDTEANHRQTKRIINPDRTRVDNTWNNFLLTYREDDIGHKEKFSYSTDNRGNLTRHTVYVTDPAQGSDAEPGEAVLNSTSYQYDPISNGYTEVRRSAPGEADRVTTSAYDSKGNLLETVVRPNAEETHKTTWTYPAGTSNRGLPDTMTSPKGNVVGATGNFTTEYTYNAAGQVLTVKTDNPATTDPNDRLTTTNTYDNDNRGNLASVTDAAGLVTQHTYDVYGRQKTTTIPTPSDPLLPDLVTEYGYTDGKLVEVVDARGNLTKHEFDTLGRLKKTTYPNGTVDGEQVSWSYDRAGNMLEAADELGRVTKFLYDNRNRRVQTLYADGGFERVRYDGAGRVVHTATPLNDVTPYGLDPVAVTTNTYDVGDRLVATVDPVNQETTRKYNGFGDLTEEKFYTHVADAEPYRTTTFKVDRLGRVIERLGDDLIVTETHFDPNGNVDVERRYDVTGMHPLAQGFELSGILPDRRRETVTVFDVLDRPIKVTDPLGNSTHTTYYANGLVKSVTDARGVAPTTPVDPNDPPAYTTVRTYNEAGLLAREISPDPDLGGTQLAPQVQYEYDANGNLIKLTNARNKVTTYQYDQRNRQTKVIDANGGEVETKYHPTGEVQWQEDQLNRRTSYTYDARGRVVRTNLPDPDPNVAGDGPYRLTTYNAAGDLFESADEVGTITRYAYDALHRVVRKDEAIVHVTNLTLVSGTAAGESVAEVTTSGPHGYQVGDQFNISGAEQSVYNGSFTITAVIDADTFRFALPAAAAATVVSDSFNRADNATSLGSAETGQDWEALGGPSPTPPSIWGVIDNQAHSTSGHTQAAVVDAGVSDAVVKATVGAYSWNWGLVGRGTGFGNYLVVHLTHPGGVPTITLARAVSNNHTTIESYVLPAMPDAGDVVELRAVGDQVGVWYNGVEVIHVTENYNQAATKWGMRYHQADAVGRFDDFGVTALPPAAATGDISISSTHTTYEYAHNDLVATTDPRGNRTRDVYDKAGRVNTSYVYPAAGGSPDQLFIHNFDALGSLLSARSATGHYTTYEYDALGRMTRQLAPAPYGSATAPAVTRYGYDAVGNLTWEMDPLGDAVLAEAASGVPVSVTLSLGGSVPAADHGPYTLNLIGTQEWGAYTYQTTTTSGNTLRFDYNGYDWAVVIGNYAYYAEGYYDGVTFTDYYESDWLSGMSLTTLTAAQALEQMRLGNFHTSTYAYDALNRLTAEASADPDRVGVTAAGEANDVPRTLYEYDANGNVLTREDPAENVTTYTYDNLDRLSTETTNAYLNAAQSDLAVRREYTYADQNFVVGGPIFDQITDRNDHVRKIFYDGLDRVVTEEWGGPGGGREMNFTYDDAGRLLTAKDPATDASYAYDALGRLVASDNDATVGGADAPDVTFTSAYDASGNRTALDATVDGIADFANAYHYDHLDRMDRVRQLPQAGGSAVAEKSATWRYNLLGQPTRVDRYSA